MAGYEPITESVQTDLGSVSGWQFSETAGAAARVLLRDGADDGPIFADIRLPAAGQVSESFSDPIHMGSVPSGTQEKVYVEVNAGAVRGALYGG